MLGKREEEECKESGVRRGGGRGKREEKGVINLK